MTPESVRAMIDQALLRNFTNRDGSQSEVCHMHSVRCCFDLVKWSDHDLRPRGICNDLGILNKKMTDKYCLQGELKKLEIELWNLKFFANENEKIDKYISGLPDNIYGNEKGNHMKDLCPSAQSANVITMACVLRSATNATRYGKETPKGNGCFECRASGYFKRDCPKLKNKNGGNRNAQGWVYAVGNAEKNENAPMNPDSNVVTGMFLLNNRYASILFDTGADRSFISTAFSSLVNIDPTPLGSSNDVELADGKIVGIDTIIRGCTINFLNHPFNKDLMPVELGSFDVLVGMDWLKRCHAVIVCDEKLVQIPYGNETLNFHGNESNNGRQSRLTVISCTKAQEYMAKGCQIFMAQISAKKEEDNLLPARPVEFKIDLIPGAVPVARAPYRLAPSEMKELSEQLQELSDKGSEDFVVYCDASHKGLGVVLMQREKGSRIPLVKVRWNSRRGPEFTWEREIRSNKNTHISSQTRLRHPLQGWRGTTYQSRNDSGDNGKDRPDQAKDTSCSGSIKELR
nr:hypothetical protein [Tanacetum cinerariifolium]